MLNASHIQGRGGSNLEKKSPEQPVMNTELSQRLTGNPLVIGTSVLKMRTRALKRVQTLMGSLGSQNTEPTLQERAKETDILTYKC